MWYNRAICLSIPLKLRFKLDAAVMAPLVFGMRFMLIKAALMAAMVDAAVILSLLQP